MSKTEAMFEDLKGSYSIDVTIQVSFIIRLKFNVLYFFLWPPPLEELVILPLKFFPNFCFKFLILIFNKGFLLKWVLFNLYM